MDVGLSNKNYLGLVDPAFEDVKFIVECDGHNDQFRLWQEYAPGSSSNIEPLSKDTMDLLAIKLIKEPNLFDHIAKLNRKVDNNYMPRVKSWQEISSGFILEIGKGQFGDQSLPICVSFSFAIINGVKICFYYECSQARNSKMVDDWFRSKFQLTNDNYTRWNHVDAGNFHNCIGALDRLDTEPRELGEIGLLTPRAIVTNWYPGIKFEEGTILTKIFGNPPSRNDMNDEWRYWDNRFENWIYAESLEDAHANYKLIDWWEHRDLKDMPQYINHNEIIFKVLHYDMKTNLVALEKIGWILLSKTKPATQAQYIFGS